MPEAPTPPMVAPPSVLPTPAAPPPPSTDEVAAIDTGERALWVEFTWQNPDPSAPMVELWLCKQLVGTLPPGGRVRISNPGAQRDTCGVYARLPGEDLSWHIGWWKVGEESIVVDPFEDFGAATRTPSEWLTRTRDTLSVMRDLSSGSRTGNELLWAFAVVEYAKYVGEEEAVALLSPLLVEFDIDEADAMRSFRGQVLRRALTDAEDGPPPAAAGSDP